MAKQTEKSSSKSAKAVPEKASKGATKDSGKEAKVAAKAAAAAEAASDSDDRDDEDAQAKPKILMPALFSQEELDGFRTLLKNEKRNLLAKAKQAMQSGGITLDKDEMYDEVDLASATVEQNLTFRLLDRDRKLLGEIEHALFKIDSGEYGYCEGTGEAIPKRRLELRPWTRHSVKFKEQLEKMKKSGRGVADEFEESEDEM